ncbi:hypothetical protein PUATCC27989T_00460 [Phytobacter ursingii]|nr:hypothetical protein PUATCC27989T_00460 [Phytobacter ursingii]
MKVKTAELSSWALDWAVATATGLTVILSVGEVWKHFTEDELHEGEESGLYSYRPSIDWVQCGHLIEQFNLNVSSPFFGCEAWANVQTGSFAGSKSWKGRTCQEAICRAVVASKLGDEVDIPDELMERQQ